MTYIELLRNQFPRIMDEKRFLRLRIREYVDVMKSKRQHLKQMAYAMWLRLHCFYLARKYVISGLGQTEKTSWAIEASIDTSAFYMSTGKTEFCTEELWNFALFSPHNKIYFASSIKQSIFLTASI